MMHPHRWPTLGCALLLTLIPASAAPFAAEARIQTGATWADNLSRTSYLPTQKSASVFDVSATLGDTRQLARDWLLRSEGELAVTHVPRYDALDRIEAGFAFNLRRKFGLGPDAPAIQFRAALRGSSFRESRRSGWQPDFEARWTQRFAETWRAAAGAGWTRFVARHEPFDVTTRRLFVETAWDVTDSWQASAGAARQWGEFTANAAGAIWSQALGGGLGPVIYNHYNTLNWEVSGTFGPGWVAYRIRDSHADHWWLEISPAISAHTALAVRYESVQVINAIGIRYDSAFWTLRAVHRF